MERRIANLTGRFDSLEAYMEFHKKERQESTPRGEKHANAKLTEDQVTEIRRIYAAGTMDAKQMGQLYGVSAASIDNIVNGATWGHVDGIDPEQLAAIRLTRRLESQAKATDATRKLTEADVLAIRSEYVPRKVSMYKLAEKYGVSQSVVSEIINRKSWTHI
jgi:plasmid maintenance system antidote protein VapI